MYELKCARSVLVDQTIVDHPEQVGPVRSCSTLMNIAKTVGEPWITFWTKEDFCAFMNDIGYSVLEDTTTRDYNTTYMAPLGREMKPQDICSVERYVVAKINA